MQDSSIFLNDDDNDLLPPPAKRQKLATFPELHKRVLNGDAEALTEILNNPSHANKFKVINGAGALEFEQILEVIDENYQPLVSRLMTRRYIPYIFASFSKLDYKKAKFYTKRFVELIFDNDESQLFQNLATKLLSVSKNSLSNSKKEPNPKVTNFSAVFEELISWSFFVKSSKPDDISNIINQFLSLIGSEMGDLERLIVIFYKSQALRGILSNTFKDDKTPMSTAIKQNNFDLVRELYVMGEYPMTQRGYLEFLIFKLNNQNEVNFSYSSFTRFSTQDFQDVLMSFLHSSRTDASFLQRLYGENFDRYISKNNLSLTYFAGENKKYKPRDSSPIAQTIRRFNSLNHCAVVIPMGNLNPVQSIKKQLLHQASFFVRFDKFELSPLEFALRVNRDEELVKDFINLGADPNFYKNVSPLDLAIELDFSIETISALFFAGASPYIKRSDSPCTALTTATVKKREDVLELFHSNGVNLDFGYNSLNTMFFALDADDERMVKFLLERNVSTTSNAVNIWVFVAISKNKLKAAKALLDFEVEKNGNLSGLSHAFVECKTVEATHFLMQSGIDPHDVPTIHNLLATGIQNKNEDMINLGMLLGVSPLHPMILKLIKNSEKLKPELIKYYKDYKAGLITKKTYFEVFPQQLPEADSLQEFPLGELQEFFPENGVQNPMLQSVGTPKEVSTPDNLGASTALFPELGVQSIVLNSIGTPKETSAPDNLGASTALSSAPAASAISSSTTVQTENPAPVLDQQFFDDLFSSISTAPQISNSPGLGF